MKVIAISQSLEKSKHNEIRAQLDIRLFNFISKCGFTPVAIPYFLNYKKKSLLYLKKWMEKVKPTGVVLSGGQDIGKSKLRDISEFFLISYCKKKKIPALGICRGMQVIGKFHGAKLIKVRNHVNKINKITSRKNIIYVKCYHNYSLKNCPKEFEIVHKSLDKNIESIISRKYRILGLMWHPERDPKPKLFNINLFKKFFNK